jgi:hypothetical protein
MRSPSRFSPEDEGRKAGRIVVFRPVPDIVRRVFLANLTIDNSRQHAD